MPVHPLIHPPSPFKASFSTISPLSHRRPPPPPFFLTKTKQNKSEKHINPEHAHITININVIQCISTCDPLAKNDNPIASLITIWISSNSFRHSRLCFVPKWDNVSWMIPKACDQIPSGRSFGRMAGSIALIHVNIENSQDIRWMDQCLYSL